MRQSTPNDIDEADTTDKLTPALELRFVIQRWDTEMQRIRQHLTPPRNKRDAARWRCPYRTDDADALRDLAGYLTALADQIDAAS